jgi:hypothetical protein
VTSVLCHPRKSVNFSITSSVHSSLPKHLGSMAPIAFLGARFWVDAQKRT